jgi:hypothetical protein
MSRRTVMKAERPVRMSSLGRLRKTMEKTSERGSRGSEGVVPVGVLDISGSLKK